MKAVKDKHGKEDFIKTDIKRNITVTEIAHKLNEII